MVYCVKCGSKNSDDARVCVNCGAQLYTTGESEHYRRMEHECFGIPRGGTIVGLAIGLIIAMVGFMLFLQSTGWFPENTNVWSLMWALMILLFGVLLVIGALYGMRRRY